MPRLRLKDKKRIFEVWANLRRHLERALEGTETYAGLPEHDEELAESIAQWIEEAKALKLRSLHGFPPYEICGNGAQLLLPHVYALCRRLDRLVLEVRYLAAEATPTIDLEGEARQLFDTIERALDKDWDDSECQEAFERLRDALGLMLSALDQVPAGGGAAWSWTSELLRSATQAAEKALAKAIDCLGDEFPYAEWLLCLKLLDDRIWSVLVEAVGLGPSVGLDHTGRPKVVIGRLRDALALLEELEAKLDSLPLEPAGN